MNKRNMIVITAVVAVAATACGSSSKGGGSTASGGSSGGNGKHTITVGVLTDETGEAASGNKTTPTGVAAGAVEAAKQGWTIKYVVGDTQTSPASALSAAQKLVEVDHVSVIIANSALTFAAAPYLKQQGIPVIGVAEDASEWITDMNMFSVFGFLNPQKVSTTYGDFFKMEGVTNVGAIGYSISPSSSEQAKAAGISAQHAGLKAGYINAQFPFGSTNVAPEALAMKNAGVNGFTSETDPNTSFALTTALRQAGADVKVAVFPDGYGGDLQQAGPGALQSAQGVYFTTSYEPVEMHTAATQEFQSALSSVGVTNDPTYAEYNGYASVALLVAALKVTGPDPSHSALISALNGVTGYNAWGLQGSHSWNLSDRTGTATGVDSCYYVTKLSGSTFQLVPGADPICGTEIPGVTVTASS